jgi:hypothetical protein
MSCSGDHAEDLRQPRHGDGYAALPPVLAEVLAGGPAGYLPHGEDFASVRTILNTGPDEGGDVDILPPVPPATRKRIGALDPSETLVVTRSDLDPVVVRYINDWYDPAMEHALAQIGISFDSSLLTMTLQIGGKALGNLAVSVAGGDRYTEEHARLIALLHEPFAIALANALKHEQVGRLKEKLDEATGTCARNSFI